MTVIIKRYPTTMRTFYIHPVVSLARRLSNTSCSFITILFFITDFIKFPNSPHFLLQSSSFINISHARLQCVLTPVIMLINMAIRKLHEMQP